MIDNFFIVKFIYFTGSMIQKDELIRYCRNLLSAYRAWKLWYIHMPEDTNPWFTDNQQEVRLCYFTLPMALNYQRDSYALRKNVLKSYEDEATRDVFSVSSSANMSEDVLREKLLKHKMALQPNKHIHTWKTITTTIVAHRWTFWKLLACYEYDFLQIRTCMQQIYKSWFPYLSWPKIFNYWSFIIQQYGGITLKNSEYIDIAPDTHITQCSVKLGVVTAEEAISLSKDALSVRWRSLLDWSWITPIQMHAPLRFWSRNGFQYKFTQ